MAGTTNFPSSLDSHTGGNPYGFAEVGAFKTTTLTGDLSTSSTAAGVADNSGFPTRGSLICGNEILRYTGVSGSTGITGLTRGADGTTVAAHTSGSLIGTAPLPANHNDLAAAIVAIETQLGAGFAASGSIMRKIDEKNGTGASGTISFTSIPQIYRSLRMQVVGRSDAAATGASIYMTFEATPTAGSYNSQRSIIAAAAASISEQMGTVDRIDCGGVPASSSPAGMYSGIEITIPEYSNAAMWKTALIYAVSPTDTASGGLSVRTNGGMWESTAAISRIDLALSAGNWSTASRVSLWGMPA